MVHLPPSRETIIKLIVVSIACLLAGRLITGREVIKDASETLTMALNLQHHGVISLDEAPPYRPSIMREPLPILTDAASVWAIDAVYGRSQPHAYFSGERARHLKFQNLAWLALLMLAAAAAARYFGVSTYWQIGAMVLVALPFTLLVVGEERNFIGMDCLTTELPGAALLLSGSIALTSGFARRDVRPLLLSSLLFGLLTLTKAAVLYVYVLVLLVLGASWARAVRGGHWQASKMVGACLALTLPFLGLTGAWMYRNYVQTGYFQISERSGPTLLYRGMLDGMNRTEYLGSFFAWTPWPLQKPVGRLIGFSSADLAAGGRLQRLAFALPGVAGVREQAAEDRGRPEDAITWYRQTRARYQAHLLRLTAAGARYPSGQADALTRNEGLRLIAHHPFMHLALVLPMLWTGAPLTFPLILAAFAWAWWSRRAGLAIYVMPTFGIVAFYAFFTQFDARYGWLPRPIATVALVVLAAHFHAYWHTRTGLGGSNHLSPGSLLKLDLPPDSSPPSTDDRAKKAI